jgi:hypothetical protein
MVYRKDVTINAQTKERLIIKYYNPGSVRFRISVLGYKYLIVLEKDPHYRKSGEWYYQETFTEKSMITDDELREDVRNEIRHGQWIVTEFNFPKGFDI